MLLYKYSKKCILDYNKNFKNTKGGFMNTYIICGVISIPLYLFYNFICYKRKAISIWIKDWGFSEKSFKVADDKYYEFQYKCSIKACILLAIIIIIGIIFKWELTFFVVFLLSFHTSVFITKHLSVKKNYLIVKQE